MKRMFRSYILPVILLTIAYASNSQEMLDDKFQDLMTTSETYEIYKVIRTERINGFWAEVQDTLSNQSQLYISSRRELSLLQEDIKVKEASVQKLNEELVSLQGNVQNISFLGLEMSKGTYHVVVWLIIFLLIATSGFLAWSYKNSFVVTDRAKKDFHVLQNEFDAFRDKSREAQVKLKRQLQTALNDVEDLKKMKR